MRPYTKIGDRGETMLYGGIKVNKDDPRLEAFGTIDELNSLLGLARSVCKDNYICDIIKKIQYKLFVVGADIATLKSLESKIPKILRITSSDVKELEKIADDIFSKLKPLNRFILPGGSILASIIHVARAICRRAERRIVTLSKIEDINPELLKYINRLSSVLFLLARLANTRAGIEDEEIDM